MNAPVPCALELSANRVREQSRARLPTKTGHFTIVGFARGGVQLDDIALIKGTLSPGEKIPVRLHSECLTGDVLGSMRCDCGDQLKLAMKRLEHCEQGVLLYLRQEGRGIGIANKVRAYALQDTGLDTVDANLHLGFDDDLRTYDVAAEMLKALGVFAAELHTNNPRKVEGLRSAGLTVDRVPLEIEPGQHNLRYLSTKRDRSGHLLDKPGAVFSPSEP